MKTTILAVLITAIVMISGLVRLNIDHKLHLPSEISNPTSIIKSYTISSQALLGIGTVYDVYLKDEVSSYHQIANIETEVFHNATKGDLINFHLAGYGGNADVFIRLINLVQNTQANVVMIVEAPIYSGHAYLAAAAKTIVMLPFTFMMFHTTSLYGYDCNQEQGTDRTVSNVDKCKVFYYNNVGLANAYIDTIRFLTSEEKALIKMGHDVYITSYDYLIRSIIAGDA